MANFTLKQKAEHYNTLLKSPALNKLKLDTVEKFKSHKQADEHGQALFETINKQDGYHAGIADSGLIEVIKEAKKEETKPESKPAAKKLDIAEDEQTTDLIETVIKAEEFAGQKWYKTGDWLVAHKGAFAKEAKGNREVAWNLLATKSGGVALPEKVEHHKTGKKVNLRNKSGKVQWSVWSMTRRWTQNIADIFKAVEVSGWDAVFPKGKLVSREELSKLTRKESAGESPLDTFKRSIELAGKKLEECPADKESKAAIKAMMAELNAQYADWK